MIDKNKKLILTTTKIKMDSYEFIKEIDAFLPCYSNKFLFLGSSSQTSAKEKFTVLFNLAMSDGLRILQ